MDDHLHEVIPEIQGSNERLVEMLSRLLEEAQEGKLVAAVISGAWLGGSYATNWAFDGRVDKYGVLGQAQVSMRELEMQVMTEHGDSILDSVFLRAEP